MRDLEAAEIKKKNSLEAKLLVTLVAYLLPLADFFTFKFSFLILPNIISNNISVPFL